MMIMISNEPNQNNVAKPNRKFSFCVCVLGERRRERSEEFHSQNRI